jgi:hypothetical protein
MSIIRRGMSIIRGGMSIIRGGMSTIRGGMPTIPSWLSAGLVVVFGSWVLLVSIFRVSFPFSGSRFHFPGLVCPLQTQVCNLS